MVNSLYGFDQIFPVLYISKQLSHREGFISYIGQNFTVNPSILVFNLGLGQSSPLCMCVGWAEGQTVGGKNKI